MKTKIAAKRKLNRRYFIIIGILFCVFIFGAFNAEAAENKTVTLPTTVTGDTLAGFDGGTCPAPYKDVIGIDIVNAFIGEDREFFFVAIPKGRFITLSFPDTINNLTEGTLAIETTGADGATGQVSAILNDNKEQILGSIRETKETQKTTFSLDQDCIRNLKAIKIMGTNNAGKYDGVDVVSVYIESEDIPDIEDLEPDTEVSLNVNKCSVAVGKTFQLKASGPSDIGFKSSNKSVATVTSDGKIKGVKPGTATITAYSKSNNSNKATCKVTVKYKLTYEMNGGVNSTKNPKWYTGKVTLQNPKARTGYDFKGWYSDSKYKKKVKSVKNKNMTLYAKWEKEKTKGNIYVLIYGAAKGATPSSTNNVNMMYRALRQLEVPGYKISKKNVVKVNKKEFRVSEFKNVVKTTFKNAGKDDLCFVYLNTHSKGIQDSRQKVRDYNTGELKDFIKFPGLSTGKNKSDYYSWKQVLSDMGSRIKGKIIFMPEVCNSGKFITYVSETKVKDRIIILAAANDDKGAVQTELGFLGGGNYTQVLSAGMGFYWKTPVIDRLVADKNKNGIVTIEELYEYIKKDRRIKKSGQSPQLYVPDSMKSFKLYKK